MIKPAKKSRSPRKALEKLYNDGERIHRKIEERGNQIYRELSPFSPKLVSKQTREGRDFCTLYDDAIKRVNSPQKLLSPQERKRNNSALTTKRNNEYLRKRFMADYDLLVAERGGTGISTLSDFEEVLRDLGYLKSGQESLSPRMRMESRVENKIKFAFNLLQSRGQVSYANLRIFLQGVHGIHHVSNLEKDDRQRSYANPLGFINSRGHFCVKDEETQSEIMKQYLFMHDTKKEWVNYLQSQKKKSSSSLSPGPKKSKSLGRYNSEVPSAFKPQISQRSRNLAVNYKKTFAEV